MKTTFIVLVLFCALSESTISQNFRKFIRSKFGASVEKELARDDFEGGRGSFGGGKHKSGEKTK
jgi:hypothetical protein